jgi:hypothetical protein
MICKSCIFWQDHGGGLTGLCRRFPPIGGETNYTQEGKVRWPCTNHHDWCGEFAPKPQREGE